MLLSGAAGAGLSGLDTIDDGTVLLEGESIHDMPDRLAPPLRRRHEAELAKA